MLVDLAILDLPTSLQYVEAVVQEIEVQSLEPDGLEELQKCDAAMRAKLKASALGAIDALLMTDAPLLHPPGLLAVAALRSAFKVTLLFGLKQGSNC